ncbi:MAG: T9SS type A sorting domain-containing protein [Candidatus Cloacimonetes bacterium]|nr:T9SS type A sorting domain-containing protein [Candidatus Cloacimonadota bacterium]
MKKQLVFVLSVLMKMRQQYFASLKNRSVIGLLMCIVILVSFTTKVYPQTEWTKYEGNPVLDPGPPGAWDENVVVHPSVLFDGTTYHMWYSNYVNALCVNIGYATSPDGITWTKYDDPTTTSPPFAQSDPVLNPGEPGEWDDARVSHPKVLLLDTTYYMWYSGSDNYISSGPSSIGRATSIDGITWDRDPDNPVLTPGTAGSWDNPRVDGPSVIYDDNAYQMWYSGGDFIAWRIGYATSPDGSIWTKADSLNPVLDWGEPGSWEDSAVAFCSVVFDATNYEYKMWYTGIDVSVEAHIGYATSSTIGINENTIVQTQDYLHQNYPNPFNPETTISYQLPENSKVELIVYNLKGQKVKTLINELLSAGEHSVIWDGRDSNGNRVGSGIYFYKMKTDNHEETKKMILMK